MARRALGPLVFAAQHIFGVGIVIEYYGFPGLDTVAGLAFLSILTLVPLGTVIILLVTTDTCTRSILVFVGLMALRTFHLDMLALKGELSCAVIKLGVFPVFFVVALGALFTQRPFVFVVLLMAPIALQRCLAVPLVSRMALLTSQGLVLAFQ